MVPHGPKCLEVPLHFLLTLLLFMWGSIGSEFRLTLESVSYDSYGILILTNQNLEFLNNWNINSYMKTKQHQREIFFLPKMVNVSSKKY